MQSPQYQKKPKPNLSGQRTLATWAASIAFLILCGRATAGERLTLVENRQPRAFIVTGTAASKDARAAAQELQTFVRKMSGAELPIVPSAGKAKGAKILVGQAAAASTLLPGRLTIPTGLRPSFDDDGYFMGVVDNCLVLAGNETEPYQGTSSAVSDFLHGLGCRWYFPGAFGEVVPARTTIIAEVKAGVRKPDLRLRDIWYSGHLPASSSQSSEFTVWKRRNRFSASDVWRQSGEFLQNPTDDSTYRLLPKERFWEAHPDYYALKADGRRNERFICMSNPQALEAAAQTVFEYFKKHTNHYAFAFSPPDEPVLCECPECRTAMAGGYDGEGFGEVSDPYFRFVFKLADRVREVCPDRWLITMAYYNRCRPPEGLTETKRSNLLIQLASIQQCSLHSYPTPDCWTRQQFGSMLRRWANLTAGQVFYEYDPHDWAHLQRPAWRSQGIAEDLRLLKQLGGWGFSNEGQMAWLSTGLNYYLHGRLGWDLRESPSMIVSEFCEKFFGPAAKPMVNYYNTVEHAMRTTPAHYPIGWQPDGMADDIYASLNARLLERCAELLQAAQRRAIDEPFRTRVAAFRGHFDRLHAGQKVRASMEHGDYGAAEHWAQEMIAAVGRVNNSALLQDVGPYDGQLSGSNQLARVRRLREFIDGSKGKLAGFVSSEALFRADRNHEGVIQQWYAPRLPGPDGLKNWRKLRMNSGWQNQGMADDQGRRYIGLGWYRCTFDLPIDFPFQEHLRLCLPEVKGSGAWVWCNGRLAGTWERGKSPIPSVDLHAAGTLNPGRNLLVIRVKGDGGLSLPPFVYKPSH